MSSLADTQHLLWTLITAPEGVGAALAADAARGGTLDDRLARTVRTHGALTAVQRLEIYANMYFYRLLDVLRDDYPATQAVLGEVGFHNLVTDYLLAAPPTHCSIREAGRRLPEVLRDHAAAERHPWAVDLARFERDLADAFDAADRPVLTAGDLSAVPAEGWAALRLPLHPSVRLLRSAWPVHEIRAAVDRGEAASEPPRRSTYLCTWRDDLTVRYREISPFTHRCLSVLFEGATFAEVCAIAEEVVGGDPSSTIATGLHEWLADGWIAAPAAGASTASGSPAA